jgi:serine/threonine protein kinase
MIQAISHFELLNKLGEGGMGVVYKARDQRLGRMVALKLLPASVTSNLERQLRFAQEGKAASALNHPNIVTIYEIDTVGETTFIAMEYIEGQTLARRIPREGLALAEVLRYSIQIAEALSAAHTAGIVHRDLKPANIMITPQGQAKILDFGVAKLIDDGLPGRDSNAGTTSQPTETTTFQTKKGIIVGTCAYMSPEQAQGLSTDARSDVFSFGSVLYEMLTGNRAFAGNTGLSTMAAILHQEPKPLLEAQTIPRDLAKIVHRCLRKDPERRFPVMADVRVALQEVQDDLQAGKDVAPFPPARTTSRWRAYALTAAALLIFAAMVASGFWMAKHQMPAAPVVRFTRVTSDAGLTTTPALSSDGKLTAYASDRFGRGDLDI